MDELTEQEKLIVLEVAYQALKDIETYDFIAGELDLADSVLLAIKSKLDHILNAE